jgi:hypothetical protein
MMTGSCVLNVDYWVRALNRFIDVDGDAIARSLPFLVLCRRRL